MEQKSNECLNMSPYLLRRAESISINNSSRIPSNLNSLRAKRIHVSACCYHLLNYFDIFGVIILKRTEKQRKIQVSVERAGRAV